MTDENRTTPASAGNAKRERFKHKAGHVGDTAGNPPTDIRRHDGEDTENSYKARRLSEMGGADTPNPFVNAGRASAAAIPADDGSMGGASPHTAGMETKRNPRSSEETKPHDRPSNAPAYKDTASTVASLERTPSGKQADPPEEEGGENTTAPPPAGPAPLESQQEHHDPVGGPVDAPASETSTEEGRNHIQLWLGLSLGLAINSMSPVLLPFMVLTFGSHVGMIGYLAVAFFIPLVITVAVAVELATNPNLRRGASGVTTIILLALIAAIEILYAFAAYRVGSEIIDVVADTLRRLGNAIIFR